MQRSTGDSIDDKPGQIARPMRKTSETRPIVGACTSCLVKKEVLYLHFFSRIGKTMKKVTEFQILS